MTNAAEDGSGGRRTPQPGLSSIGENDGVAAVKERLLEACREAERERPAPYHLTRVGNLFSKSAGVPFEQFVNFQVLQQAANIPPSKRKMAPFIQAYCRDELVLVHAENGDVTVSFKRDPTASKETVPRNVIYQKPVWVAFIRPIAPGKRRYLKVGENTGFVDLGPADSPEPGWLEIMPSDTLGAAPDAKVDPAAVQNNLAAWLQRVGLDPAAIEVKPTNPRTLSRLETLYGLIDSLPTHVVERWQIPASVLAHLRD